MEVCLKNREVLYSLCCTVGKSLCDSDTGKGLREYAGNICKEANDDVEFNYSKWQAVYEYNYINIVGNGTADDARSNAYALDWEGNGHYMGDIYVHSNADSSGGTKVATVADIPNVPVTDVQVNGTSVLSNGVANIPIASNSTPGVVRVNSNGGIQITNGYLLTRNAQENDIKAGTNNYLVIGPAKQHISTFYGLSKVAGVDLKDETVTLGTYPETSKIAIRSMLNAASPDLIDIQTTQPTATDNKLWIDTDAAAGIQVPTVSEMNNAVVEQVNNSIVVSTTQPSAATNKIWINSSAEGAVQVPTVNEMNTALGGKVSDVQVNSVSVVNGGVANIPIGSRTTLGVVGCGDDSEQTGIVISNDGIIKTDYAGALSIKQGANLHKPIVPYFIKEAVFYGMAKAAGDSTQSSSANAVGTYTSEAQAAIKTMLGVQDGLKVVRLI